MKLTPEQLKAIQERADKATPGPLKAVDLEFGWAGIEEPSGLRCAIDLYPEDAEFWAHARTDIPALLDHATGLQNQLADVTNEWHMADEEAGQLQEENIKLREALEKIVKRTHDWLQHTDVREIARAALAKLKGEE